VPDINLVWNLILSAASGLILWWVRGVNAEISDTKKIISITREEMAREYALKIDVDRDMEKLLDRLDRLDSKLDKLLERIVDAGTK
jgi:hypothetical protein